MRITVDLQNSYSKDQSPTREGSVENRSSTLKRIEKWILGQDKADSFVLKRRDSYSLSAYWWLWPRRGKKKITEEGGWDTAPEWEVGHTKNRDTDARGWYQELVESDSFLSASISQSNRKEKNHWERGRKEGIRKLSRKYQINHLREQENKCSRRQENHLTAPKAHLSLSPGCKGRPNWLRASQPSSTGGAQMGIKRRADLTQERVLPGKYQNKMWGRGGRQGNEDYIHDRSRDLSWGKKDGP